VRRLFADPHFILDVLNGLPREIYGLCTDDQTPEGTKVISVYACHERRSIGLLISHPSFDIVPDGEMPPDHVPMFASRRAFRRKPSELESISINAVEPNEEPLGPSEITIEGVGTWRDRSPLA
jgi:hypothetical protein